MARTAVKPIRIAEGVEVHIEQQKLFVKGPKGQLEFDVNSQVSIKKETGTLRFEPQDGAGDAIAHCGTARANARNLIKGVVSGYERRLELFGVGFRAQVRGRNLNLNLGFSHPVDFAIPDGIKIETPSQTEIVITGIDKHNVGQVAAKIRGLRKPDPYKGKGVRYANERVVLKEAKKK